MKRAGQPAELATAYVMLADPLSSYTSGTTVAVTGGKPFIRMAGLKHPVTPDGRYFVVRGKLWRMSNPCLAADEKSRLVKQLMNARRAVKAAKAAGSLEAETAAHRLVDEAKRRLGEPSGARSQRR
ncbi:hypothetical protein ABIF65_010844 [Bradyrhizobium japonicum]|jgi:hypothetical protein